MLASARLREPRGDARGSRESASRGDSTLHILEEDHLPILEERFDTLLGRGASKLPRSRVAIA